jgi:hypothetical protein
MCGCLGAKCVVILEQNVWLFGSKMCGSLGAKCVVILEQNVW